MLVSVTMSKKVTVDWRVCSRNRLLFLSDFISPQLYETGTESSNDFSTNAGVPWKEYVNAKAAFVPSIVKASMYSNAQSTFANYGVTTKGYIQWAQV
jgi:hypothetical protein